MNNNRIKLIGSLALPDLADFFEGGLRPPSPPRDAVQGKDLACGECFGVPQQMTHVIDLIHANAFVEKRDSHVSKWSLNWLRRCVCV